jgi:hypothetical protein
MKKKLLFAFTLVSSVTSVFAQQRLVLSESFSQASCGPCASQNPAYNALMDANPTKVVSIKYQTSWPGVDPMYSQNPTEIDARTGYYGVSGVPERVLDGTVTAVTQASIDARYALSSPVNMTINHTINSGFATADVNLSITAPAVWAPSNTVLHLALVEKVINFSSAPGSNGETVFHNVMRKMYPGSNGTAVVASNFSSAGGTQTFNLTGLVIPSYIYNLGELEFVAWVQNTTTKEIYQAGISHAAVLSDYAIVNSLVVPQEYSCASSVTGAVAALKNNGSTVINSATVNYKIDMGAVATAPFTGAIAVGSSVNFTIPTTATTSGSHTLTSYLTNINGSGLSTPIGTATTNFATISGSASGAPISQNFTSSAFPYANYYVNSTTNDNWVRATANSGCIKYDNYSYASGKKGNVYLAPIQMTALSAYNMTFDVAYRQYASENDKLEVFASTDCGTTWASVYSKSGASLKTGAAQTASFTPASSADWRNEAVDLSAYSTASNLLVKYVATSNYGNNLYVDNINLGALGLDVVEAENEFQVYPNPATENVSISFNALDADYSVSIIDLTGRIVISNNYTNLVGNQVLSIPVTGLLAGNYIIRITSKGLAVNQKLSIK